MSSGEITNAELAKKIDEQSRFTRSVSIICTLAVLGVMFYTLTEMFSNLPQAIVLHYMANMDKIVHEQHEIERAYYSKKPAAAKPEAKSDAAKTETKTETKTEAPATEK